MNECSPQSVHPHLVNGGFAYRFHAVQSHAVSGNPSLLGFDSGGDGTLNGCIYVNSANVFLSHSAQSFLNDRLR